MTGARLTQVLLRAWLALVILFLLLPILVVVPLSFSSASYLRFPPPGWSLRWYARYFSRETWLDATWLSLWVGLVVAVLATVLGTLAAFGLMRGRLPLRGAISALIVSPLVVPAIVAAIGIYFAFARAGITGSPLGLVLAHVCLAVPFVVATVSSALVGFDRRLEFAAMSLGAGRWATFWQVTFPLLRPAVLAGTFFAFITSFDELIVALFLSGSTAITLPRRMWDELRFEIDPTIAAVSTLLVAFTLALFLASEALRRRGERLRAGR
jgi:putative spermidine/putrescine transport system permease protein